MTTTDKELEIIIDLVNVKEEERELIENIKKGNKAQMGKSVFEYLKDRLKEATLAYTDSLHEAAAQKSDLMKDEVSEDIFSGVAKNDTLLRRIEIAENQQRKKEKLNELLRNAFIVVAVSSIIPGLFMTNILSRPVAMVVYILVLLSLVVYVVYGMVNMKHERNPLSVREKLFKHPNIKMIFQSKMLSDMADVDDKINELESLVKTVELPPEMMKQYIDNE